VDEQFYILLRMSVYNLLHNVQLLEPQILSFVAPFLDFIYNINPIIFIVYLSSNFF